MSISYLAAVWIHIFTVSLWVGAMFFEDPKSDRFFSRLLDKMHGIGWYAQAVLWTTGLYMLIHHGFDFGQVFSTEFFFTLRGLLICAKGALVMTLLVFQAVSGNKPSKLIYGYVIVIWLTIGVSAALVRIKLGLS